MMRIMLLLAMFFCYSHQASGQQQVEYGNNPQAGKYIVLNGVRHYYEVYGSGRPLLLIHGNSTATKGWASQIAFFSKKYTVYSIDCRGRGKSDLGQDSLTYMQQAKDAAQFITQLRLDSVYIVGKSDGGIIALLLGIYFPAHIAGIVAYSANLEPDASAFFPESFKEIHDKRVEAEQMIAAGNKEKNWTLERQLYRLMEFQPHISDDELQQIAVPVLVMSNDRDVIREEHTFHIYKNIRHANLCILPNEQHSLPRKHPDLFNAMVDRYLETGYKSNAYRFEK